MQSLQCYILLFEELLVKEEISVNWLSVFNFGCNDYCMRLLALARKRETFSLYSRASAEVFKKGTCQTEFTLSLLCLVLLMVVTRNAFVGGTV